jgi:hypothetical protein
MADSFPPSASMSTAQPPTSTPTPHPKTPHSLSCHCRLVQATIHIPDFNLMPIVSCNCSICSRNGYIFIYVPVTDIEWRSGYESLKRYRFGKRAVSHAFCDTCGSSMFEQREMGTGTLLKEGMLGLNVSETCGVWWECGETFQLTSRDRCG